MIGGKIRNGSTLATGDMQLFQVADRTARTRRAAMMRSTAVLPRPGTRSS